MAAVKGRPSALAPSGRVPFLVRSSVCSKPDLPSRLRSPEAEALWSQFPLESAVQDRGEQGVEFGGGLGLYVL